MRIIGGDLKGKNILPPANYGARPTTDFAKEGLFNILINEYDIEELSVLDLFSGTGSISLEFASRGCQDIVSVEMNPMHARFIKQVATAYKVKGMQVVRHNVFDFLNICTKKFDIIFADPPYSIEGLDTIPDKIFEKGLLLPDGYLILEHPGTYNFEGHQYFVKEKKYGNVHFSFFRPK
ncbi:MAG: RsmD family RNA methyltransferase [Bacteroidales bacterium]|nr:RsmD family RNA methyltransferase [Bacteroidales bacterium]